MRLIALLLAAILFFLMFGWLGTFAAVGIAAYVVDKFWVPILFIIIIMMLPRSVFNNVARNFDVRIKKED